MNKITKPINIESFAKEHYSLITEFMGKEHMKGLIKDVFVISPANHTFNFHKEWRLLKPVIDNVQKTIDVMVLAGDIEEEELTNNPILIEDDIEQTYINVVEFIKFEKENILN